MSNYLNHLVAKSLNQVETIQPRPRSRFEPFSKLSLSSVGVLEELPSDDRSSIEPTNQTETAEFSTQSNPLGYNFNPPLEIEKQNESSATFQSQGTQFPLDSLPNTSSEEKQVIPKPSNQDQSPPLTNAPLNHSPKLETQPSLSATNHPSLSHSSLLSNPASFSSPSSERNADTEPPKEKTSPSTIDSPTSPILPRHLQTIKSNPINSPPSLQPITQENRIYPHSKPSALLPFKKDVGVSQPSSQPEATPTIQVNIGSIEIRATQPQPSKPKPRSKSPKLSLDEYLQQRTNGAR